VILWRIGVWYKPQIATRKSTVVERHPDAPDARRVKVALLVAGCAAVFKAALRLQPVELLHLLSDRQVRGLDPGPPSFYLFIFLAANAAGAFFGGPLGDRYGRKYIIWFSILGALPFTLALPYAGLFGSAVLSVIIGLILSSATSSIIVFAQELMPHRFGMISGVFFGVAFGIGGLGAAVLGRLADHTGIAFVYHVCASCRRSGCSRCSCRRCPNTRAERTLHGVFERSGYRFA